MVPTRTLLYTQNGACCMDIYRGPEFHLEHQSKPQSHYLLRWYDCTQSPNQVMTLVTKLFQQEQYAILYDPAIVTHME